MNNKKEKFARFGIASKGFVYCLIGGLTAMTATGAGGKITGGSGALEFLADQTFGKILLVGTAVGLTGFVFYRFYQAFTDPEDKGSDFKGTARRFGYFFSGVFYGLLAFTAVRNVAVSGSSGGGNSNESMVGALLNEPFGQVLVGVLGVVFLGKALWQFYRAYSGKFKESVAASGLHHQARKLLLNAGKIGYTARGIVIAIIAFLTFRAAITASSSEAGGTKDAFTLLQNEFGVTALLVIALGLVAYGAYMFVKAKYREMALH